MSGMNLNLSPSLCQKLNSLLPKFQNLLQTDLLLLIELIEPIEKDTNITASIYDLNESILEFYLLPRNKPSFMILLNREFRVHGSDKISLLNGMVVETESSLFYLRHLNNEDYFKIINTIEDAALENEESKTISLLDLLSFT